MPGLFENIKNGLDRLSSRQKIQMVVALLATVGLIWGVAQYSTRIRYGMLYSGMNPDDTSQIVEALKAKGISYRLERGGRVIEVPAGQVDELRMELAGEGLPRGGGVGFEIFDKPSFGLSDFVQNVNYQRALERELARSIQSLDSVEAARVHLALPPESVFADEKKDASASVVVRLRGNRPLANDRVQAISHLVASGVEGLDSSRVSVVDGQGTMLTDGEGEDNDRALSSRQLESKRAMEDHIESILLAILEPVVGSGNVRASATVELQSTSVERIEEKYDPNGAVVRSEQKAKTKNNNNASGGVPGTGSNVPGGTAVAAGSGSNQESQTTTTNFEINKVVSTIAEPRGTLLRQSIAVVVDHALAMTGEEGGESEPQAVPRTEEEMRQITDLVSAAAGIDEQRGDVLIVENVPFDETLLPTETMVEESVDWMHLVVQIARYSALPLAVLLIVLLVVRPGIAALRSMQQPAVEGGLPPTVAELQARLGQGLIDTPGGGSGLRNKLIEAAAQDPDAAAVVVRGWLGEKGGE